MGLIDEISTKRIHIGEKIRGIFFFYIFAYRVKDLSHLVVLIMFKIDSSLSFSSDLVRGVHSRASVRREAAKDQKRGRRPLPSLAFSHAHSNFEGVKITPLVGLI